MRTDIPLKGLKRSSIRESDGSRREVDGYHWLRVGRNPYPSFARKKNIALRGHERRSVERSVHFDGLAGKLPLELVANWNKIGTDDLNLVDRAVHDGSYFPAAEPAVPLVKQHLPHGWNREPVGQHDSPPIGKVW